MTTQPSDWAFAQAFREACESASVLGVYVFIEAVEKRARELDASGLPDGTPPHWGDVMRELEAAIPDDLKGLLFRVMSACDQRLSFLALRVRELEDAPRAAEAGDKDGERYRWLRGNLLWAKSYDGYVRWTVEILMPEPGIYEGHLPVAETLDAAIDAARAGERG